MKLLFVLKCGRDKYSECLLEEYAEGNEIDVFDLSGDIDYKDLLDKVESCDKLLNV